MARDFVQAVEAQASKDIAPTFDAAEILTTAEQHAVKFKVPGSTQFGTGFFVSSGEPHSCEAATLSHVTGGQKIVSVVTPDGQTVKAELVKVDWRNELSVYQLKDVNRPLSVCQEVQISRRSLNQNERLLGVGISPGLAGSLPISNPFEGHALGYISRKEATQPPLPNEDMDREMLIWGGPGQHGFSGAAIYDMYEKVVAIEAGAGPDENTNLAEFAWHLQDVLDQIKAEREAGKNSQENHHD
jgi:S1-C subfamily serine protease